MRSLSDISLQIRTKIWKESVTRLHSCGIELLKVASSIGWLRLQQRAIWTWYQTLERL